ncbi:hypothetical protein BGZ73_005681 [Actinomortierella ambigua]|nr:hypothetical protein BGZ73_005681 [Actinomortierella ambigua]
MATTTSPSPTPKTTTTTTTTTRKAKNPKNPSVPHLRKWTKEVDDQLRVLGAQAGKTMTWHEVADQMQIPLSSIYSRYCKLMDSRLEQLVNDQDRMRELDHLAQFQLHWCEIAKIMGVPASVVEPAYKRRHPRLPSPVLCQLFAAIRDPKYQSDRSSSVNNTKSQLHQEQTTFEYLGRPVDRWPEMDWQALASDVFSNKVQPEALRANYIKHRISQLRFSPSDHAQLRAAVLEQLKAMTPQEDESRLDWAKICHDTFPGQYSPSVCQHAWMRQREPGFTKLPWQEDEMVVYWQQYLQHGQQWHLVAKHLPNRIADDCRRDFQKLARIAATLGEPFQQRVMQGLPHLLRSSGDGEKNVPVQFPNFFFAATSWTPELDARLMDVYQKAAQDAAKGRISSLWETVAARLNAGASVLQCARRVWKLQAEAKKGAVQALEDGQEKQQEVEEGGDDDEEDQIKAQKGHKKTPTAATITRVNLTREEKDRLTHLVQTINPKSTLDWSQVAAQMPSRPTASLKVLWGDIHRSRILDDPQGPAAVERAVLKHGDGKWHAISEDLTHWLYRDLPSDQIPTDPLGAARVRPRMAKALWARLHRGQKQSSIWMPDQVEALEAAVRKVVGHDDGRREPTLDDWLVIGRQIEGKNSLHCKAMWEQLQTKPGVAQQQMVAQAVLQHLWLYGKLPTEQDKAQWSKDNPGVPLQVPEFMSSALAATQRSSDRWSPAWDEILDMTVERYGVSFGNFRRLAEILGTTEHHVRKARHRMVRRKLMKSLQASRKAE